MTIECYYTHCPYHISHFDEEGPFCFEKECRANSEQLKIYAGLRKTYLESLGKQLNTYDEYVIEQKRIWFGQLYWWRLNKFIKDVSKLWRYGG